MKQIISYLPVVALLLLYLTAFTLVGGWPSVLIRFISVWALFALFCQYQRSCPLRVTNLDGLSAPARRKTKTK